MDVAAFAVKAMEYCRLTNGSIIGWVFSPRWMEEDPFCHERIHVEGLAVDVRYDEKLTADERNQITALLGLVRIPSGAFDHIEAPRGP